MKYVKSYRTLLEMRRGCVGAALTSLLPRRAEKTRGRSFDRRRSLCLLEPSMLLFAVPFDRRESADAAAKELKEWLNERVSHLSIAFQQVRHSVRCDRLSRCVCSLRHFSQCHSPCHCIQLALSEPFVHVTL